MQQIVTFASFLSHFTLKFTFFRTNSFLCSLEILPEDFTRVPSIYFILFKKIYFYVFKSQHYVHHF